jgi:GNAT superfamily N-acetyltransferase
MGTIQIRKAQRAEAQRILEILQSVAIWLETIGPGKLWSASSFRLSDIEKRTERSEAVVLIDNGKIAACMFVEDSDDAFWPEARTGEALYLHKLVVDRQFAGRGFSKILIDWAAEYATSCGKKFLRLDCVPRERLVEVYIQAGFERFGNDAVIDGYRVARLQRPLGSPSPCPLTSIMGHLPETGGRPAQARKT